ncbi:hypothetical protein LN042_23790, partial [Kitasatospora sp. RB6PN24]|uniref:hypothetical protein n=1 Tax=Kitasatospora humi TaxID=2893891 RepID=UPI001E3B72A8
MAPSHRGRRFSGYGCGGSRGQIGNGGEQRTQVRQRGRDCECRGELATGDLGGGIRPSQRGDQRLLHTLHRRVPHALTGPGGIPHGRV